MPASGPYRSRLFNVLHRQTRQWAEQSTQVWRHFKVATLWSVQLLLYPVYWAFQTGRVVGKQLQQAERQVAHFRLQLEARRQQHPPLTADTAIHNVLQAIQALFPTATVPTPELPIPPALPTGAPQLALGQAQPDAIAVALPTAVPLANRIPPIMTAGSATPLANTPTANVLPLPTAPARSAEGVAKLSPPVAQPNAIRAIASLVDTRTLVLVTAQNQVLDILTPQQQQWLYQRLADEVASFRRYQQIAQTPHWQFQVRLFPPKLRQTQFPPVRYFRALMAWMQQGPVAKLTNLFDEATLLTGDRWDLANLLTLPALPTLADIASSGQPTATAALPPPSSWLGTLPQSASTLIQQLLHQEAAQTTGPVTAIAVDLQWEGPADLWASALPPRPGPGLPGNTAPVRGIPCPFPPSSPEEWPAALPPSPVTSAHPVKSSPLPWSVLQSWQPETSHAANWAEAGVNQPVPISQWQAIVRLVTANSAESSPAQPPHLSSVFPARGMSTRRSRRVSPKASPPPAVSAAAPLMPPPSPSSPLPATPSVVPTPGPVTETAPIPLGEAIPTELSPATADAAQVPATTLLEVEAQIMGYVKHPLEHVLEWLDQIMLWIETIVGRFWRWLQAHLPQL